VIVVNAQSHKQIPKQSPAQQQKTETDKRGTEQVPFIVKTIPTPKSEAESQQDRKEREEKASQAQWTIRLAWAVAIATFLQALFLLFTLRETKKAANAAKRSADVLPAIERGYLFVNIKLDKTNKSPEELINMRQYGLTGRNRVQVYIINHGKTPAIIKSFHSKVDFYTAKQVEDFFTGYWITKSIVSSDVDIIEGGKPIDEPYPVSFDIGPDEDHYFIDSDNGPKLLCIGIVRYADIFNNSHETVFCWEFRQLTADFYICEKYNRYNYRT